jgi:hypothetical protein
MRCPNCGNENPPDYMFCDECGARLTGADQAADPIDGDESSMSSANGADEASSPASSEHPDMVGQAGTSGTTSDGGMDAQANAGTDMDTDMAASNNMDKSGDSSGADEATPVTEDTMPSYSYDPISGGSTDSGDSDAGTAPPMPDVMPITSNADAQADDADTFEAVPVTEQGASDDGGMTAAAGAGASMGAIDAGGASASATDMSGGTGGAWATEALRHLDVAQRAIASGDWAGFGQALNTLRSALESAASGAASGMATQPAASALGATSTSVSTPAPTPYTGRADSGLSASGDWGGASTDNGASAPTVPSYVSAGSQPMSESVGETGAGMAAMATGGIGSDVGAMEPDTSMGSAASIGMSDTGEAGIARLVVISTGAELSLPDQEEITVGREDPSSGIFPDVDLTPYGGEDGGVSRRHARMLHIGDDYFVEDLQSTNYTKLDGQRLPAHVRERLEDGARLDFGRVAVIFRRS